MLTNKRRGADKERRVANKYRAMGCLVMKSGGSIGPADLIVIDPEKKEILLIQCKITKNGYLPPKLIEQYQSEFERFAGTYQLRGIMDISKSYERRCA